MVGKVAPDYSARIPPRRTYHLILDIPHRIKFIFINGWNFIGIQHQGGGGTDAGVCRPRNAHWDQNERKKDKLGLAEVTGEDALGFYLNC